MKTNREISLIIDILVQFFIGMSVLIDFDNIWVLLFIGGTWQVVSNYIHLKHSRSNLRLIYRKLLLLITIVTALTVLSAAIQMVPLFSFIGVIAAIGLVTLLVGGITLYIVYFIITFSDFARSIKLFITNYGD